MTTELEKQFFDTFGIEPKYQDTCTVEEKYWDNEELANEYGTFDQYMNAKCGNQENCSLECSCAYQKEIYPQITDRHYLELILIISEIDSLSTCYDTVEHFKEGILECFIEDGEEFKHQVQAIFKGER
jgi:hypothetical protein